MTQLFPPAPPVGTPMLATRPGQASRTFLALRRSANKAFLSEPGPSPGQLDEILAIAARVPDHRKLTPWRFIVFEGQSRVTIGQSLSRIVGKDGRDVESRDAIEAAGLFLRAPTVVAVISSPRDTARTPAWEQELSAGAVCYNLLLAANASGWAGVWLSEWVAYDRDVAALLGLSESERVAGFIYLGTATQMPQERLRGDVADLVSRWHPPEG